MAIRYTPWADPLLDYINNDLAVAMGGASSPFAPINYNADLYANEAKLFAGNFGFDGYIGVPGLVGGNAQQAAAAKMRSDGQGDDFTFGWNSAAPNTVDDVKNASLGTAY